mmetsp:Transcript_678/g.1435  ORF Transcript_678/g.1435 Transcript_678/m.1435 type:complete len:289 (-) Transcript_678:788-1654(-)
MPRDGTDILMRVRPFSLLGRMSRTMPLRAVSLFTTAPVYSSSTSIVTSSTGSSLRPPSTRYTTWGGETASSKPSRRMFSMRMPSCSSPRPYTSNASPFSSLRFTWMLTLFSVSLSRRSQMSWEVSLVPSRPWSGESLGLKVMHTVGGSMGMVLSGSVSSGLQIVSVTVALDRPASCTMSPAVAEASSSTPPWPLRKRILVIRPESAFSPLCASAWMLSPTLTLPLEMRPVRSRPRKVSCAIIVTTSANSGRGSGTGGGTWERMVSSSASMFSRGPVRLLSAQPFRPAA